MGSAHDECCCRRLVGPFRANWQLKPRLGYVCEAPPNIWPALASDGSALDENPCHRHHLQRRG